jgi:hypothetical protein
VLGTPAQAQLLVNGGFEEGVFSADGLPTGWATDAWDPSAIFIWDDTEAHEGTKSVKIVQETVNDARWIQSIGVLPNTDYCFSGWIKTEDVGHTEQVNDAGANLSVFGCYDDLGCHTYAGGLFGDNDWTLIRLGFNSGSNTDLMLGARVGMFSGVATGTAWFDDLELVEGTGACAGGNATPTSVPATSTPSRTATVELTRTPTPTSGTTTPVSTPTSEPTGAVTATPTPVGPGTPCVGDCDGSDDVTVDEVLTMVSIALGTATVDTCAAADSNDDGQVTVDEILAAVQNALNGCPPAATPS